MGFIVENENNKYINILYMNNTFKLWFKQKIWSEFTSLYYDKNLTIDSLFKLSNSKNLYNNIHHNNTLEFNCINVFDDIKIIIKNNLDSQLSDWEKIKPQIDKIEIESLSSFNPDIKLEDVINYTDVDENELKYENGFAEYLLKLSGAKNVESANMRKKADIRHKMERNKVTKDTCKMDDGEILIDKKILKDINKIDENEFLDQRVDDFLKNEIEKGMEYILKEKSNTKKEMILKETSPNYTINTTESIDGVSVKKQYVIPEKTYGINTKLNKFINKAEKEVYVESYNKSHDRIFDITNEDDNLKDNENIHDFMYKEINIDDNGIDDIITDEEIKLVKETIEQKKMIIEDKDITI